MPLLIKENVSLAPYTTFKIGGPARFFCIVSNEEELYEAVAFAKREKRRILLLGGGSNILISDVGFSGVVIKNEIMGKVIVEDTPESLSVSVGAGELWDEFVGWAVERELYGIENLSAIPGTVGAAPVQNIGAYGSEISETVVKVRVLDTSLMKHRELSSTECMFSYRDSVFKVKKGRFLITRVDFKLKRVGAINIEYKDLREYFAHKHESSHPLTLQPSLAEVREAVIDIRWRKLPDWKLWGTAGSYFKNPVIAAHRYERLKKKYPDVPGFKQTDGRIKVPVAWLLDRVCNAKGLMIGNVGTYENQALVLVTRPGATAAEVISFAKKLMELVEQETTIKIEAEVEWVN